MGLKDMFRRKPGKRGDKKASHDPDRPIRQRQDATVMIPSPGTGPDAPTQSRDAATNQRAPDDTTERMLKGRTETAPSQDAGATVAIDLSTLHDTQAGDGGATVAFPVPGFDNAEKEKTTSPPSAPNDVAATVAVPVPSFEDPEDAKPASAPAPQSDAGATVAVPVPSFDEPETPEPEPTPAPPTDVAATVAVPIPNLEDADTAELQAPPPTPTDVAATVAVPVPRLDDDETEPLAPAPATPNDVAATVAVPVPGFDAEAGRHPGASAAAEAGPLETRFDLPEVESEERLVTGVLVAIDGELSGLICPLGDGETKIGRSDECDVVVPSLKVSREHTTIVHQDGVFAILPLSERNPTYVNDEVVSGCELNDGDCVRMGRTSFRFRTIEGL